MAGTDGGRRGRPRPIQAFGAWAHCDGCRRRLGVAECRPPTGRRSKKSGAPPTSWWRPIPRRSRWRPFNNLPPQAGRQTRSSICVTWPTSTLAGPPQQNIVVVKGQQSVLIEILKKPGTPSTLAVVSGVKAKLPGLPQDPFRRASPSRRSTALPVSWEASIEDVVQQMLTAGVLAGLAVLLFVGSWRVHPQSSLLLSRSSILEFRHRPVYRRPDDQRHDTRRPGP